jgi:hypothetical protein
MESSAFLIHPRMEKGVFCEVELPLYGVPRRSPGRVKRGMRHKRRAGTNTPALLFAFS